MVTQNKKIIQQIETFSNILSADSKLNDLIEQTLFFSKKFVPQNHKKNNVNNHNALNQFLNEILNTSVFSQKLKDIENDEHCSLLFFYRKALKYKQPYNSEDIFLYQDILEYLEPILFKNIDKDILLQKILNPDIENFLSFKKLNKRFEDPHIVFNYIDIFLNYFQISQENSDIFEASLLNVLGKCSSEQILFLQEKKQLKKISDIFLNKDKLNVFYLKAAENNLKRCNYFNLDFDIRHLSKTLKNTDFGDKETLYFLSSCIFANGIQNEFQQYFIKTFNDINFLINENIKDVEQLVKVINKMTQEPSNLKEKEKTFEYIVKFYFPDFNKIKNNKPTPLDLKQFLTHCKEIILANHINTMVSSCTELSWHNFNAKEFFEQMNKINIILDKLGANKEKKQEANMSILKFLIENKDLKSSPIKILAEKQLLDLSTKIEKNQNVNKKTTFKI